MTDVQAPRPAAGAVDPLADLDRWRSLPAAQQPSWPDPGALALNVDAADQVAEVVAAFRVAGGTVRRPAGTADGGGTTAYVADPDGHLWEVAHNPGFPLDERGAPQL